jgi:serine/threonine-protein kinase RIO1
MIANEYEMLTRMQGSGYVPAARLVSDTELAIEDLGDQLQSWRGVTDRAAFMAHLPKALDALKAARVRHGDLTIYAIIVVDNKPMLIDFAQSLDWDDPSPDKQPEGDAYWLARAMSDITEMSRV